MPNNIRIRVFLITSKEIVFLGLVKEIQEIYPF